MMYVDYVTKQCTKNQLAILIKDLDKPQKEYQGFRVGIEGQSYELWKIIPVMNDEERQTNFAIIDNLQEGKLYKICGEVKFDDKWEPVKSCSFVTQDFSIINNVGSNLTESNGGQYNGFNPLRESVLGSVTKWD